MREKKLRSGLARAVDAPFWITEIGSPDGELLKGLQSRGFVELSIDQGYYELTSVTESGQAKHREWNKATD